MVDQGPSTLKFKSVLPGQGISECWALVGRVWKGGNPRYDNRWRVASEIHEEEEEEEEMRLQEYTKDKMSFKTRQGIRALCKI